MLSGLTNESGHSYWYVHDTHLYTESLHQLHTCVIGALCTYILCVTLDTEKLLIRFVDFLILCVFHLQIVDK